jgi:hypothetical protein
MVIAGGVPTLGVIVTACWDVFVPLQPPVIVYIILQLPADTPVTSPEEFTVAIPTTLLLHTPVPPPRTTVLAE